MLSEELVAAIKIRLSDHLLKIHQNFPRRKKTHKGIIYHYTTLSGLKGIIESQKLFASNSLFMNDKQEIFYGMDLFRKVAAEYASKNPKQGHTISLFVKQLNELDKSNRYITCFSCDGDLLSQWRAYANNGGGFAIGFDALSLAQEFGAVNNAKGYHVIYRRAEQEEIVNKLIEESINFILSIKKPLKLKAQEYRILIATILMDLVNGWICQFKHESFSEELEFRVEVQHENTFEAAQKIFFRDSQRFIIPYLTLMTRYKDFSESAMNEELGTDPTFLVKNLPIREIILGPSLDSDVNEESLKLMLLKYNYTDVAIRKSDVPYRI